MCDIAATLDLNKNRIAAELAQALKPLVFGTSYINVWHDFEKAALELLPSILKKYAKCLTDDDFQFGVTGTEKNRLTDLGVLCNDGFTAISIKAARKSKSPRNDLGTFKSYPEKKRLFNASFEVWIRYDDSNPSRKKTDQVFFDRSYKFVGKRGKFNGVSYHSSTGNMRPKTWRMFDSNTSYWNTPEEFEEAVRVSDLFRANDLVNKHLGNMTEDDQRLLYELLKKKFELAEDES